MGTGLSQNIGKSVGRDACVKSWLVAVLFSFGASVSNSLFVTVLIFLLRSVVDPLLHICWEPEFRNGFMKIRNCV